MTPSRRSPTRDGSDEDLGIAAWASLLRTQATVVRVLDREVEGRTGLPLAWYDVLLELNAAESRRLRMQELSRRVVLSRTRVSRLVVEIERAGLVERIADPDDGRATLAVITSEGRRRLRAAAPVYLAGIREHFADHLTERQLRTLRSALGSVLDAHSTGFQPGDSR